MARFRIKSSRSADGNMAIFTVSWLDGSLAVGQSFEVYEAGHWWIVPVVSITKRGHESEVLGDIELLFDDQFSPAIVDTNAVVRNERFRYDHA